MIFKLNMSCLVYFFNNHSYGWKNLLFLEKLSLTKFFDIPGKQQCAGACPRHRTALRHLQIHNVSPRGKQELPINLKCMFLKLVEQSICRKPYKWIVTILEFYTGRSSLDYKKKASSCDVRHVKSYHCKGNARNYLPFFFSPKYTNIKSGLKIDIQTFNLIIIIQHLF